MVGFQMPTVNYYQGSFPKLLQEFLVNRNININHVLLRFHPLALLDENEPRSESMEADFEQWATKLLNR